MAPLLKFQFAAHLTRFDGHQRRNPNFSYNVGILMILHWHSWKSSSGNPGGSDRCWSSKESILARHVSWSLVSMQTTMAPFTVRKKYLLNFGHPHPPPRVNYHRRNLGNFSKVQDFTSLLAMLCHLKQLLIHHGDDVDQRLRIWLDPLT